MKKIYVCSQYRGDTETNVQNAKDYCRYVVKECGSIPIAPHIYFMQFLDDDIPSERAFGIAAGLDMLCSCDELWYFGDKISQGMVTEIITAKELGIPVRYVPDDEIQLNSKKEGIEYVQEQEM